MHLTLIAYPIDTTFTHPANIFFVFDTILFAGYIELHLSKISEE